MPTARAGCSVSPTGPDQGDKSTPQKQKTTGLDKRTTTLQTNNVHHVHGHTACLDHFLVHLAGQARAFHYNTPSYHEKEESSFIPRTV